MKRVFYFSLGLMLLGCSSESIDAKKKANLPESKTIDFKQEESIVNQLLSSSMEKRIIIYGKNVNDMSVYDKYEQLIKLGFRHVYVYPGGLFEWLCLQDIYSSELFPTSKKELDILKYKPSSIFNTYYLMDIE